MPKNGMCTGMNGKQKVKIHKKTEYYNDQITETLSV